MSKLTAEQQIQRAHVWLMGSEAYRLYAGIFMIGQTGVVDAPGFTAATNGRDTKYGREFVGKQNEKTLRGLILHENLHKALRHMTTWENLWKEDAMLANKACDYVINLMIVDSDPEGVHVQLPEGGCFDTRFKGMDAGQVFKILKQEQQGQSGGGGKKGNQQDQAAGQSGAGGDGEAGGFDEHEWGEAEALSDDEKKELERQVDQALRQGVMMAGRGGGNVPREVSELLTPKVNWREALREFINSFCAEKDEATWRKVNRRWVGQGVYMPGMVGESVGRLVVAVDMSGSIGAVQVGQFLGEVRSICETVKPEGIDLLYWDTAVCQHEKYEQDELDGLMSSTKPRGGGGTMVECVPEYIKERGLKPECVVVLTDGYMGGGWGTWPCPVLWAITSDVVSPVGKSVKIGE